MVVDEDIRHLVGSLLPSLLVSEESCIAVSSSSAVSHLIAILETSPSPLELSVALNIIDKLVIYDKAVIK